MLYVSVELLGLLRFVPKACEQLVDFHFLDSELDSPQLYDIPELQLIAFYSLKLFQRPDYQSQLLSGVLSHRYVKLIVILDAQADK